MLFFCVLTICITIFCVFQLYLKHFVPIKYDKVSKDESSDDCEDLITVAKRIDKRLSHIEDWCGQIESRIKDLKRD
jgi:hypothetical protein